MATRLLTDVELAEQLGFSVHTLRADRQNKRRVPFLKIGRSVRYNLDKVAAELAQYQIGGSGRVTTTVPMPRRPNKRGTGPGPKK